MININPVILAIHIIETAFKDKKDLAGEPYINHIVRVSESVPDGSFDKTIKQIAILHDLLEDCPEWNAQSLSCFFKQEVIDSVIVLTRIKGENYNDYISRIITDWRAVVVKKYDLIDNMDLTRLPEILPNDIERLKKYHKAYIRIINELNK